MCSAGRQVQLLMSLPGVFLIEYPLLPTSIIGFNLILPLHISPFTAPSSTVPIIPFPLTLCPFQFPYFPRTIRRSVLYSLILFNTKQSSVQKTQSCVNPHFSFHSSAYPHYKVSIYRFLFATKPTFNMLITENTT